MGFFDHKFKGDDLSEFAKPSVREKASYAVTEGASASVFYFAVLTFSNYFYTDVIGIAAGTIGLIVLVSRIFDGITDLAAGWLMDKTKSKHGRARMWFFWTSIPYAISLFLIYTVPATSMAGKVLYIIITYNFAVTVMFTLNNMPWNALGSFMTRNQKERDQLFSLRIGASNIGGALVSAVSLPIVNAMGGYSDQSAWIKTMAIYAILCYVLNVLAVFMIKERVKPDPKARSNSKRDLPVTLSNPYFWGAIAIVGAYNVFQVATMTFMPYYATYILGDTNFTSIILPMQSGLVGLTCFLVTYLQRRGFKKGTLIKFGAIVALAGQIVFAMQPENLPIIYVTSMIRGFGFGFTGACMFAFAGDAIEYGHWRTGHRAEGTTTVASGIGNKLGVLLGSGVTTVLLGAVGYDGTASVQVESALTCIKVVFIYAPMFFAALLFVIMIIHKMDKKYTSIMDDLMNNRFHPKAKFAPEGFEKSAYTDGEGRWIKYHD